MTFVSRPILDRFDEKVAEPNASGCIIWTGASGGWGYGIIWFNGKKERAHRVAWMLKFGSIPDKKWVLHKCDNPKCVNTDHLFLGDHQANEDDKVSKQRQSRGTRQPLSVLTEEAVREIRASRESNYKLAQKYGVRHTTIQKARTGKTWKFV